MHNFLLLRCSRLNSQLKSLESLTKNELFPCFNNYPKFFNKRRFIYTQNRCIPRSCFVYNPSVKNSKKYSNMSQTQTVVSTATDEKTSVLTLKAEKPKEIFRKDYKPPEFTIHHTDLTFNLDYTNTKVVSTLEMQRRKGSTAGDLVLDGDDLTCESVFVNGQELKNAGNDGYYLEDGNLVIPAKFLPSDFETRFYVKTAVTINPSENKLFMGLFKTGELFCTQCESHGFRRITYFLDRPDVMSMFRVRIEADSTHFPVLLSNGNKVEFGATDGTRHYAVFDDPFKKPSYLFALVAGPLSSIKSEFVTKSGKTVKLSILSEPQYVDKLKWALDSVKKSMKWDEDRYGLEYDLDNFNVVCVRDFNMGAMENKGLNVFNTDLLLADEATTTDSEFMRILSVVGHEYFHNWTGNRVTCRDWFQLTLKEGLTVFRESQFISDMWSKGLCRINDVQYIKGPQFAEDAGPLSHPIRLESYISMNNFYTITVYDKGSEVIKMIHTILGESGFRSGIDLYFKRHDGDAVTCDDFLKAMADANNYDFSQFELWYSQSGTPVVDVLEAKYLPDDHVYTLTLKQSHTPSASQPVKKNMHIPIKVGLIDKVTKKNILSSDEYPDSVILHLKEGMQTFEIPNVHSDVVVSLLRDFSAPVKLNYKQSIDDLSFLMAYDTDPVNKWSASNTILSSIILSRLGKAEYEPISPRVIECFREAFKEEDKEMKALLFKLPDSDTLSNDIKDFDPFKLRDAKRSVLKELAHHLREEFLNEYKLNTLADGVPETLTKEDIGRRTLRNVVFGFIVANKTEEDAKLAYEHYSKATKMGDRLCALQHLCEMDTPLKKVALDHFYNSANGDIQVIEKWFRVQALADTEDALENVIELMEHEKFSFTNPNSLRALVAAFTHNIQFHREDGKAYSFLSDVILKLDPINHMTAARICGRLTNWKKYDSSRQKLMVDVLKDLLTKKLSPDVYEIVHKSLTL